MLERPRGGGRAVLVNLDFGSVDFAESLEEIRRLAESADLQPVAVVKGKRQRPDAATFAGSGKVEEIAAQVQSTGASLVLFNHDLSPAQERNLEKRCDCRVIDRTSLILDIFAQRARSHEGKLQVELAQLEHLATRLVRGWTHLERQKGGIGLRGPGETQLETDRQLLRKRVKVLKDKLATVRRQRQTQRRARLRGPAMSVSLVGYTNAGKSTLFNRLTDSDAYAADQLFATLDTTSRRISGANDARGDVRHRWIHPRSAACSGGGIQRHARRDGARRSVAARGGRRKPRARRPDRGSEQGARGDRRGRGPAGDGLQQD